ncbi:MAG TPA: hypothetical protein VGL40_00875 [Bacillota bacterium]|jgi:3-polyprenyl-4-hydroxybenzoate decarboxylase
MRKIAVGITGATGSVYGVRLLQALADRPDDPSDLARYVHSGHAYGDVSAPIATGSFGVDATAIVPIINHTVGRVLDHLGLDNSLSFRWRGPGGRGRG